LSAPLIVACGYIMQKGLVLLARRKESGLWEMPGGKLEPGETLPQCLARELDEELGIRVEVQRPLGRVTSQANGTTIQLHCYLCALTHGIPQPREHTTLAWSDPDKLYDYQLCPADKELLSAMSRSPLP
jgi:mutator protein MutT